jgi:nucleoside-diphosphate-sugar epimerase
LSLDDNSQNVSKKESSLKVLFAGCGDIALRTIQQLRHKSGGMENRGMAWQPLAMRRHPRSLPADIASVAGDVRDARQLISILDGAPIDAMVVTLSPDQMSDEGYRSTYVAAATAIAEAIERCLQPPKLVLWVSSTGVYGQSQGEWVDELSVVNPGSFRGKRLLEAEDIIHHLPVSSVVVRFSGIYGPGRDRLINKVKNGDIAPEIPVHWTNRIHAEDCAGVIAHLLTQFFSGAAVDDLYVATDNLPVPAHEVQSWLASELGISTGSGPVRQAEAVGSDSARPGNRRCKNQRLRQSGYAFIYPTFREGYRALLRKGDALLER